MILISFITYFRNIPRLTKLISTFKAVWYTIGILTLKGNEYYTTSSMSIKLILFTSLLSTLSLQSVYISIMTSLSAIEYDQIVEFRQLIHSGFKLLVNENTPVLKPMVAEVCIFLVIISTSFVQFYF